MIKLASITPVKDHELSLDRPIAMFLTHLVLSDKAYAESARNYTGFKILDNSLIEMGAAMTLDKVLEAAGIIDADEIVLPDVFKKRKENLELIKSSLEELKAWYEKHPTAKRFRLMAVAQGESLPEFFANVYELNLIPEIDTIGIPKAMWGRGEWDELYRGVDKDIHFLGCPDSLDELRRMSDYVANRVRSIDTCIPALLSQTTDHTWATRPIKTIDLITDRVNVKHYNNIIKEVDEYLERRKINIYLAGPLFSESEREARLREARLLRKEGYEVFNPIDLNLSGTSPSKFFTTDLEAMKNARICIARVDGYDSGTMAEIGWFFAHGIPVIMIWSDSRSERITNLFIRGIGESDGNFVINSFDIEKIKEIITGRI